MTSSRGLSPRVNRLFNSHLGHIFVAEMLYFYIFICTCQKFFVPLQPQRLSE